MSGIVGIVNLNGAPVDPRLLQRMTDSLAFRGPDAQQTWIEANVGFGHTLLKTTFEAEHEHQPFTLDGKVWIVADARIDAQAELKEELRSLECGSSSYRLPNSEGAATTGGKAVAAATALQGASAADELGPAPVTDVELILRAYHAWGENCVEHLLGDFAFGIWDGREQRLFCARDHMGVKPFYYAHLGPVVIFSNTLDCVRLHPAVSDKLNDLAIGDFLLTGYNPVTDTTTFADIQRLPAAHAAVLSNGALQIRRYWTLPIDDLVHYHRPEDYTERFNQLLRLAVRERIRTDRLGIFMSGGLDSPGMAVAACDIRRERPGCFSIDTFTGVYDHAIPHQERYYAGLVAKHLGIPIHFYAGDREILTPWEEESPAETPEPVSDPYNFIEGLEYYRQISAQGRVLLHGEGPDNALRCEWRHHLALLVKERRWGRLLPDFWWHVVGHPRVPFVGRLTHWIEGYRTPFFPGWINPGFASRLNLHVRWGELQSGPPPAHPTRPKGYQAMSITLWQHFFESFDILSCRTLLEVRHPYIDLRMVRFLLSVPAIPWCCNKCISRRGLADALPRKVIRRPKSPLAKAPNYERARRFGMPKFPVTQALLGYVSPQRIPDSVTKNIGNFALDMRAIGLAYWLRDLDGRKPSGQGVTSHDTPCEPACSEL